MGKDRKPRDKLMDQLLHQLSSVQVLSRFWLFETPLTAARQASYPSLTPRAYSNSCPLSQWCHPTISSSVSPSFPLSQSLPSGGFLKPLIFLQEGRQNENHNQRKLTKLIPWTIVMSSSMKLRHVGPPKTQTGHGGEFWQNVVHWRREWQTISVFLPWECHEQYEKAKR